MVIKDTVISAGRKKTELKIAAYCLATAIILNIVCIICYHTPWYEVFTQIGYTVIIAAVLYVITILVRLVVWACKKTFRKNN